MYSFYPETTGNALILTFCHVVIFRTHNELTRPWHWMVQILIQIQINADINFRSVSFRLIHNNCPHFVYTFISPISQKTTLCPFPFRNIFLGYINPNYPGCGDHVNDWCERVHLDASPEYTGHKYRRFLRYLILRTKLIPIFLFLTSNNWPVQGNFKNESQLNNNSSLKSNCDTPNDVSWQWINKMLIWIKSWRLWISSRHFLP